MSEERPLIRALFDRAKERSSMEGDREVAWMLVKRGDASRKAVRTILNEMESPELYAMRRDAIVLAEMITDVLERKARKQ